MYLDEISDDFSTSSQIHPEDARSIAERGFRTLVNLRPDDEEEDQPQSLEIAHAVTALGIDYHYLPMRSPVDMDDVNRFKTLWQVAEKPLLAFCLSGSRARVLWQRMEELKVFREPIAGELNDHVSTVQAEGVSGQCRDAYPGRRRFDVLIIGGGAGGIACAASLLRRQPRLSVGLVDPAAVHDYQPGQTLVGRGVFRPEQIRRRMETVLPAGVRWLQLAAVEFAPRRQAVQLSDGSEVFYDALILAPGLDLHWSGIAGLQETLGQHGVTSNYRYDLAPYTWQLVQNLRHGQALFTQPPMPIKCAGAPQKALYLSCDAWRRQGRLGALRTAFHTATPNLFGVADYVPALMEYIRRYGVQLKLGSRLVAVDGPGHAATFESRDLQGHVVTETLSFDLLHVTPPQRSLPVIAASPFADQAGWIAVHQDTLQQVAYPNVFGVGDACGTPNAKTAAAVRKQAPVVAENVLAWLANRPLPCRYNGYGACPLTVERGKIVLAEFGYGGRLLPTLPALWLEGRRATRRAWLLKCHVMPWIYWEMMLKGREWLARPEYAKPVET